MDYWARARYDLRLSDAEFFALTPRQFSLLCKRRREDLAHREMVSAYTTAAVVNHSMLRPEEPANPMDYMPSHTGNTAAAAEPDFDEETIERMSAYQARVMDLACEFKRQAAARGE